jgi:O-antigen ligase
MYRKTATSDKIEREELNGISIGKKESFIPLSLLLFYLVLEYGRPQELLPFLQVLHLPAITIVLLAIWSVLFGKFRLKDKQTTLIMFLLGLMVVHGPIAINNYWALMIFITMTMNFIVFLSLIRYVDNVEKFDKLVKIWLLIHVFLAIIGIVRTGRGIGGFLADENDFCMTMNMIIPFSFFISINTSGRKRLYYIVLTCLFLFVIILSKSRGGFVGIVATFTYCWLRTKRKILTAFIIGVLAVLAVVIAPPTYWNEVRSITEEGAHEGTGEERFYTWKIGWHIFLDNPIIGVGQGNFPWVFKKYELEVTGSEDAFYGRSVAGRAAHSIYFTMLPELGILGTCFIFGMIYYTFKDLKNMKAALFKKDYKVLKKLSDIHLSFVLALEGSLISYLVSGAFISTLYYPNLWILMGFIVSFKHIVIPDLKPDTTRSH